MANILLFVSVFSGITCCFAVSEVKFSVRQLEDNSILCEQTQDKPAKVTVIEDKDIKLSIDYGTFNSYFQCIGNNNPSYVFVKIPTKSPRTSVISVKATRQMSGLFVCTIYTNKDVDVGIEPVVDVYIEKLKGKFTELRCFVDVHVRLLETPQTVLVNNIKLPTERMDYTEEEFDHSAMYYYLDNDLVTVQCLPGTDALKDTENPSPIEFKYDYAEKLEDMFKKQLEDNRSKLYGFRTKLQARHDNSVMICKYHGKDDYTTIKVTFVRQTIPDNVGFITINELVARPFQDKHDLNSEINYLSVDGENVDVVCTSNTYYLRTAEKQENCETGGPTFTKSLTTPFEYNCYLCLNKLKVYSVKVVTNKLDSDFKELKTSEQITLTSRHDNNVFECMLRERMDRRSFLPPVITKRIKVLFRKRPLTTITTTTTTTTTTTPQTNKFLPLLLTCHQLAEQVYLGSQFRLMNVPAQVTSYMFHGKDAKTGIVGSCPCNIDLLLRALLDESGELHITLIKSNDVECATRQLIKLKDGNRCTRDYIAGYNKDRGYKNNTSSQHYYVDWENKCVPEHSESWTPNVTVIIIVSVATLVSVFGISFACYASIKRKKTGDTQNTASSNRIQSRPLPDVPTQTQPRDDYDYVYSSYYEDLELDETRNVNRNQQNTIYYWVYQFLSGRK